MIVNVGKQKGHVDTTVMAKFELSIAYLLARST